MSGARAIAIGAFDGVHLGHAGLIRAARSAVGGSGRVTALAFEPHPLRVLRPRQAPAQLSSFRQRRDWLLEAGADEVTALEPTAELLGRSPQSFLEWVTARHAPEVIVEGSDFRFGCDRSGSVATLKRHERLLGYRAVVIDDVEAVLCDQSVVRVTSSLIRWLVRRGRVRDAAILLGRTHELAGEVVPGDGRGSNAIGVPTANLDHGVYLLPADGIYAGVATGPDGGTYPAAISVGTKPTFGEHPRVCEAHLVDYEGPTGLYGWTMTLQFHDWLRDQITYDTVERLIEQIHRDIARVKEQPRLDCRCSLCPGGE